VNWPQLREKLRKLEERIRAFWEHKRVKKMRTSTKAGISGLVALVATSGLAEKFHAIDDWESLIVLIVTWLAARLSKTKAETQPPVEAG
jgi:hypothetical protein